MKISRKTFLIFWSLEMLPKFVLTKEVSSSQAGMGEINRQKSSRDEKRSSQGAFSILILQKCWDWRAKIICPQLRWLKIGDNKDFPRFRVKYFEENQEPSQFSPILCLKSRKTDISLIFLDLSLSKNCLMGMIFTPRSWQDLEIGEYFKSQFLIFIEIEVCLLASSRPWLLPSLKRINFSSRRSQSSISAAGNEKPWFDSTRCKYLGDWQKRH